MIFGWLAAGLVGIGGFAKEREENIFAPENTKGRVNCWGLGPVDGE